MNTAFQPIFNQLERQRIDIVERVKGLSAEKFNYSPAPEKWSISQILTHILVAEELSLKYMKKKALGIDHLGNSGPLAFFRIELLKISQRIPAIKFKAPKVVLAYTPPPLSMVDLEKRWESHRNELKEFLSGISDGNTRKLIYKHVIAGRLNAEQAMIFFREHINHHWPQIKRLL